MSTSKYALHYFTLRCRGELARLLLVHAGVQFDDKRIGLESWFEAKAVGNYPYGQLPVLFVNDKPLAQSLTIARYLANELGLNSDCPWGRAVCDQVVDSIHDLRDKVIGFMYREKDPQKQEALKNDFYNNLLPAWLTATNTIVKANPNQSGFLYGDKITWADIAIMDFLDLPPSHHVAILDNHPAIKNLDQLVRSQPHISEYLATRPDTPF